MLIITENQNANSPPACSTVCLTNAMAQLSIAQRTFIVKTFYETGSLQETRNQFRERFPERPNLALSTIWYNVRKFEQNGTSLNRNKENSGRRRSGRSAENIALVRNWLAEHPTGTSARRNGVGIPSATFNRITRLDLRQHHRNNRYRVRTPIFSQ